MQMTTYPAINLYLLQDGEPEELDMLCGIQLGAQPLP